MRIGQILHGPLASGDVLVFHGAREFSATGIDRQRPFPGEAKALRTGVGKDLLNDLGAKARWRFMFMVQPSQAHHPHAMNIPHLDQNFITPNSISIIHHLSSVILQPSQVVS